MLNFSFLEPKKLFVDFAPACIDAERSLAVSYSTAAMQTRRALELAVKWVYSYDSELKVPYQDKLSSLIHDYSFRTILDSKLFPRIRFIVDLGNKAAHTSRPVTRVQAVESLHCLYDFIHWIDCSYSDKAHTDLFNESLLSDGLATEAKDLRIQQELERLQTELAAKDKTLEDLLQKPDVRTKYHDKREQNQKERPYRSPDISEFKTRKIYIDLSLFFCLITRSTATRWILYRRWLVMLFKTGSLTNQFLMIRHSMITATLFLFLTVRSK